MEHRDSPGDIADDGRTGETYSRTTALHPHAQPLHPVRHTPRVVWVLLALGLLLRLVHLDAPPLGFHAWRQADTAGVARNFAREGMDILRPRADWRGTTSGVAEMELPVYPFAAAVVYRAVGVHEWVMRLMSALASAAAGWFLFRLVSLLVNVHCAAWACGLWMLLPLSVYYGRSIQPEATLSLGLAAGMWWMARWSRGGSWWLLAPSGVGIALACAMKVPTLYIGLPIALLCWQRLGWRFVRDPRLWAYAAGVVALPVLWHWHARTLGAESGVRFMFTEWGSWGRWKESLTLAYWNRLVFGLIAERHLTWPGFLVFAAGLVLPRRGRGEFVFDAWCLALLVYYFLMPERHRVHEYYQYPGMLAGAVYAAKVFDRFWDSRRACLTVLLVAMAGFGGFRLWEYWRREDPATNPHAVVARHLAEVTAPGDLVAVLDGIPGNPTVLYLADRKGWVPDYRTFGAAEMAGLERQGARAFAVVHEAFRSAEQKRWIEEFERTNPPTWMGEAGAVWAAGRGGDGR